MTPLSAISTYFFTTSTSLDYCETLCKVFYINKQLLMKIEEILHKVLYLAITYVSGDMYKPRGPRKGGEFPKCPNTVYENISFSGVNFKNNND